MEIRPYTIHVEDEVLDDLKFRLERTRWPEPIRGSGWEYGSNIDYIKELCAYWQYVYDWRHWEAELNKWPSFMVEIDGVDIRFWHVKGKGENPFPLLMLHGWPGASFEFFEMIGPLTDPASYGGDPADCFDVVIPDLPGFGFSGHPKEPGWGADRMAQTVHTLMTEALGYSKYGAQGGDWGSMICARLGIRYPEQACALHLNYANLPIPMIDELPPEDMEACDRQMEFDFWEGAYHLIMETKADSLTVAQCDSPAGFAAWVIEKFRTWSDCNGDLESVYTKDQLLTIIMFYWAGNSIFSAARLYYESFHNPELHWGAPDPQIKSPTGVAFFPKDPFNRPKSWAEKHYNLVRWNVMPCGGHFPALEQPALLTEDVRSFFRMFR